ncbi:glycosyltransferase family 2 protein [Candidatus Pelagibacter sp. HIMB1483]|uniref:glycosyltransferase family 2 protein n=1 Tax=Candidatus Pelagibacter sp. HIMB1483 TaxID=3415414 RepID=UPI003F86133A
MDRNLSKLSILIPCFNEKKTINKIFEEVEKSLIKNKFLNYEIIIIDDCSTDGTVELLQNIEKKVNVSVFYHKINLGKGSAIQTGLKNITGDIVIIQDADLEYDPNDYPNLLLPFFETDADVVYGSRFLGGGKYVRIHFFWHYLANKILTFLCNLVTNLNLTDMETGYKLFKSSMIKNITLVENSFSFEPEVTIKLAKKKNKFYEVPITYKGRSYEEGKKIGLKDAFIAVKTIFLYSFKS